MAVRYARIIWGNATSADVTAVKAEMLGITRHNGPAGPPSHVAVTRFFKNPAGDIQVDAVGPAAIGELNSLKGRLISQLSSSITGGVVEEVTEEESLVGV